MGERLKRLYRGPVDGKLVLPIRLNSVASVYGLYQLYSKFLAENEIPNLKHQITNKSQKTIFNNQNNHRVESHRFMNPGLPAIKSSGTTAADHLFGILNLGHWDFFEIWFFGAWNFHDFL